MTKLTLSDLTSLTNETSAITTINQNNAAIEAAIELLLSRNGASPNMMNANLDMNSFRILNTPVPTEDTDLVRLVDITDGITGPTGPQGPAGPATLSDAVNAIEAAEPASAFKFFVWDSPTSGDFETVTAAGMFILQQPTGDLIRAALSLGGAALLAVGTTAGTVAAGDDSRFTRYPITTITANASVGLTDVLVRHTSATPHALTIDPVATTAHPLGKAVIIRNAVGAGVLTLTRGAGVALYANGSTTSANVALAAGASCTLIQEDTNTWFVIGPGLT